MTTPLVPTPSQNGDAAPGSDDEALRQVRQLLFGEEIKRQSESYEALLDRLAALEARLSEGLDGMGNKISAAEERGKEHQEARLGDIANGLRDLADRIEAVTSAQSGQPPANPSQD